jgi:hypothetical protein
MCLRYEQALLRFGIEPAIETAGQGERNQKTGETRNGDSKEVFDR